MYLTDLLCVCLCAEWDRAGELAESRLYQLTRTRQRAQSQ